MPLMNIATDKDGFLVNLKDWNEETATQLAANEGIDLTEYHWEILHLIRKFYNDHDLSPAMRPLVKFTKTHLGEDKGTSLYLLSLFPGSPAKLAAKIAGLPKPDNCL